MYNGIGLQTARGSGTNGYVQTNKFFVRANTAKVGFDGNKGFGPDQGTAGLSKKPNTEILEHDRKRQIELKLVTLEDKLSEQGYSDADIAVKVGELRKKLEAEAAAIAAAPADGPGSMAVSDTKMSDTQTHQVAARKEKQMEKLRVALGITEYDADAIKQAKGNELDVDGPKGMPKNLRKTNSDNDSSEREEGEFLSGDEDMNIDKHHQDEVKTKHKSGKRKQANKRKGRRASESDSESSEEASDSESDSDRETTGKTKSAKTSKKVIRGKSSDSESDELRGGRVKKARDYRAPKRHDSGSESDSRRLTKHRHDSDSDIENDRWKSTITPDRELVTDRYKTKTKGDDYNRRDEHKKGEYEKREGDGLHKRKPERHEDQIKKLERRDEDDNRGKKRERKEESEQRDVKRERREEGEDGGRRREKREEEKGGRTREVREVTDQRDGKRARREEEKDKGRWAEKREEEDHQRGRPKEMREVDWKNERWVEGADEGRREKRVEEELGGKREMREGDVIQDRRNESKGKDSGRREKEEEDDQVGRTREAEKGYTRHARILERKEEDGNFSKKRERRDEDEERVKKRERRNDEHGSRNRDKRGEEEMSRKEKDGPGRKNREGKEEEYRSRRSEDKESSRRYQSDDVRRRH